jgi:hypothetical protein
MMSRCGTDIPSRYVELFFWTIPLMYVQLPGVGGVPFAHCEKSFGTLSVNVVVALSPELPVAVTRYWATRVGEIEKLVVKPPFPSAVTSELELQLLPTLSFTKMWTASFGTNPAPVRTTVDPGA